jgi:3-oxoisoapionate kinase
MAAIPAPRNKSTLAQRRAAGRRSEEEEAQMSDLLMTFYGDDFTGSTDAMECLELNGIPAVLFLALPSRDQLERFPGARAFGVAGVSRTLSPEQMDRELLPVFEALKELGAPFFHYKICSTFDSSPRIGSIGHAIELGWRVFAPPMVPMMVGAPFLRRYVAFGNLFARVGEATYRLDRHPTMSRHPITPMREADLRLHLAQQTSKKTALIDLWHLSHSDSEIDRFVGRALEQGAEIVLFDTLDEHHMKQIGRIVWRLRGDRTVFLVGSSGFEYSLGMHLASIGAATPPGTIPSPGRARQMLVMSGSCAPPTAEQIEYAQAHGFGTLRLDAARLVDPACQLREREEALRQALECLDSDRNLILYTALGPEDPAIPATRKRVEELGLDPSDMGHCLGTQQGILLREILERKPELKRVCVAGGDTCGYAARQLGIYALQMLMPIAPGAPLCRASSGRPRFDGLEISLKGGQNGVADYLVCVLEGRRREAL